MIRSIEKWLPGYLISRLRRCGRGRGGHVLFCVADHFEPLRRRIEPDGRVVKGHDPEKAARDVCAWLTNYRDTLRDFRDAEGYAPRHTFFYPCEEYAPCCVDPLAAFCAEGSGEVEIHLHHRKDTPQNLEEKLTAFKQTLRNRHGLLGSNDRNQPVYAFVHGNWALCNSRPDGDWCGVDHELTVLSRTGCYADFTFPSAPSPTQPRRLNCLYRPSRDGRRAADYGTVVRVSSGAPKGATLPMIITGPLALAWTRRKAGVLPRLDNAELTDRHPGCPVRVRRWIHTAVTVRGRPDWVFVKTHGHGMAAHGRDALVGTAAAGLHRALAAVKENGMRLHYVTAREMFNIARAAEDGKEGDPSAFRDYEVSAPPACRR